jgi:hypothetical protein
MQPTVEAIRAKCEVREDGCWVWTGSNDGNGQPRMRLPKSRKLHNVRRVILETTGQYLGNLRSTTCCGTPMCVNPEHILALSSSSLIARAAKRTGYAQRPERCAAISATKRKSSPLTPELVAEIRSSPESTRVIAKRLGVHQSTVQAIRSGQVWKTYDVA